MADGYDMVVAEGGAPALVLAGATVVDPDATSGNPNHEIGSGRFGAGKGQVERRKADRRQVGPDPPPTTRDDQRPDVLRRRDAIVDAARELTNLTPDGVREFVRKRWRGTRTLEEADIEAFAADARRQRIEDLIDTLDWRIRRGVYGRGGSKNVVRLDFPRGLARQTIRGLDQNEINSVLRRLRDRGWTADQVRKHVVKPFDEDKRMASEIGALQ